jgi:hypothetical protein
MSCRCHRRIVSGVTTVAIWRKTRRPSRCPRTGEPPPVVISELEPLPTQLASKDPILFHQIRQRASLLAIQPTSQDREHDLESRRVDHGGSQYHGVTMVRLSRRRPNCGTLRACRLQLLEAANVIAANSPTASMEYTTILFRRVSESIREHEVSQGSAVLIILPTVVAAP